MPDLLAAIDIETAPNPDAAVIWMHGLGDDGRGWSEVVPALGLPRELAVRFLFPHAPVMPVTINNGMQMRAWYDIRQANLNDRADLDGVRQSQGHVERLLARERARGPDRAASRVPPRSAPRGPSSARPTCSAAKARAGTAPASRSGRWPRPA
jgi:predicted esterase